MSLINREALYEKACDLEAQALSHVGKIVNDETRTDEWRIWSAILAERTAFKHDIFDAPEVKPELKWIPCEKRLPELWSEVLTTWIVNGEYKITRAELRPHGWFALVFPDDGRYKQDGCIAWMPLPEPYAERRTDG